MKLFSCVCGQLVFFESVVCTRCKRTLAFLPDRGIVAAVEAAEERGKEGLWRDALKGERGPRYRPCRNGREFEVCNWAVPVAEPGDDEYCRACRLNQVIPNLSDPAAKEAWHKLEIAKRRLLYTLMDLELPVASKTEDPEHGLAFSFLKDDSGARVFTGHSDGLVTINVAEADDPFREKMRVQMGEPYRTLLGHFRHESGHYYWDRLVAGTRWLERFRELFGDETLSYAEARDAHYQNGAPADWPSRFVSAYASMHPWEDWAETWAHYLHMTDTLETARAYDVALKPKPVASGDRTPTLSTRRLDLHSFDDLMSGWVGLSVALNSLNRSMGLADPYPFVVPAPAVEKLRFVHEVIARREAAPPVTPRR
jgi:hypothetical protein